MKKSLLLYLLFIGLPAFLLGIGGARLLVMEQHRVQTLQVSASEMTARLITDDLATRVNTIEAGLLDDIRWQSRKTNDVTAVLRRMEETNPFVRNVFIWQKDTGLLWPRPDAATNEERGFIARYATLLDKNAVWGNAEETAPVAGQPPLPRRGLRDGWIPWFEARQLFLLGWTETAQPGTIAGVELETTALLGALHGLVAQYRDILWLQLRDGNGVVMMQTGDWNENTPQSVTVLPNLPPTPVGDHNGGTASQARNWHVDAAATSISLAPYLPHWTLAWQSPGPATNAGGFVAFGVLLLAVLLAALFGGGALLVRDARRQRLDAMRKTDFVSNVSHELKTPLTSIRMYAELLAERRVNDPALATKYLGIIVSESKRLSRLVGNVLDFSRLEQGRKKYSRETIDANTVVRDALDAAGESLTAAGLRVTFEPLPQPAPVSADRDALSQVLLNVLDNAAKYAAAGKELDIAITLDAAVRITISDHGPGIPVQHREKIFEKFYRVDTRLTADTGGSGLGLGIARRLMRGMGGDITCRARDGGGACFIISLGKQEGVWNHE